VPPELITIEPIEGFWQTYGSLPLRCGSVPLRQFIRFDRFIKIERPRWSSDDSAAFFKPVNRKEVYQK